MRDIEVVAARLSLETRGAIGRDAIAKLALGATKFAGEGWSRPTYFSILISHTILAVVIVPFVLVTLWRALSGQFLKHSKIARFTLPVWLYVSVTGVLVYLMLYKFFPVQQALNR